MSYLKFYLTYDCKFVKHLLVIVYIVIGNRETCVFYQQFV